MKVLLVNGSPHQNGCTFTALCEIEKTLKENGIESEMFWIGNEPIGSCVGCGGCAKSKRCVYGGSVNTFLDKVEQIDGIIVGSPVHFAAASGNLTSFLDRAFYGKKYYGKPGAAILSCRRGGSTAAFDQLNKYFTIAGMPVVSSQYWNGVHGNTPAEVRQDAEGMQIMRTLARNMAWLLKCIEAGREKGIQLPEREPIIRTNFIR